MTACVIDTSAVLAHLQGESGGDAAFDWLAKGASISILNVQELASKLAEAGVSREDTEATITDLGVDIRPITIELAVDAGFMRLQIGKNGLSHGDRASLTLARSFNVPAVTADRVWLDLAKDLGVEVVLVR